MRDAGRSVEIDLFRRMLLFVTKAAFLFIPTFFVIYFVGTFLLVGLFGILGGTPYLVFSRDLAGMPFIFYALGIGWKVALMVALIIWSCSVLFAAIGKTHKSLFAWLLFLLVTGAVSAFLAAVPVLRSVDFPNTAPPVGIYYVMFIGVGWICCASLSPLWFFAFGPWLSP